jgi:hypothetical protein
MSSTRYDQYLCHSTQTRKLQQIQISIQIQLEEQGPMRTVPRHISSQSKCARTGHTVASVTNDTILGQIGWNGYSRLGRPRYLGEAVL